MKWHYITGDAECAWVLTEGSLDKIAVRDCVGYATKIHDGTWACFIITDEISKYIGKEFSSEDARNLIEREIQLIKKRRQTS